MNDKIRRLLQKMNIFIGAFYAIGAMGFLVVTWEKVDNIYFNTFFTAACIAGIAYFFISYLILTDKKLWRTLEELEKERDMHRAEKERHMAAREKVALAALDKLKLDIDLD